MSDSQEKKKSRKKTKSFVYGELASGPREAYKRLRTNVICSFDTDECHVVGMTSAMASEGKSLTSINLASTLAEIGKKVILIDADVYRPSIHKTLNVVSEHGISELTKSNGSLSVEVHRYVSPDNTFSFDFVASGRPAENTSEVLNSPYLERLINRLRSSYDFVIVDMPPIGLVSDVAVISKLTDGVLVVVRESHTPASLLRDCVDQLKYAKANTLGFVLNGSTSGTSSGYSYGYGYGYGSGYGYGYSKGYGYGYSKSDG